MSKTIYIGGRLESKAKGNVVTGANAILDDTKGKKQNVINKETDDELLRLEQSKQDNLNFDNAPTENSTNPVTSGGVYTAEKALSDAIEAILLLIPSAATELNKLVDTNTMNSSISTATATFRGTYNAVSDLGLTYQATHAQIEAALDALGLTADSNDFAFVQIPVSDQSQDIAKTERFKFNGTNWLYEYDLNTSGFTAAQWAAINSGITVALVTKLTDLPTAAALQLALNAKQDTLTFDNEPTALSQNPVTSGGIYTAIQAVVTALGGRLDTLEGLIPSEASSSNKLTDKAYVLAQILAATPAFKGQFTTLAELQAVASPKAGDLGIVRTKDSDGMDVFTVYQYLSNAWNVFYSLSYHPQTKPATTGTTGDYPYNGMGRVELAKNMVNGVNTLTQDMFYKGAVGSRVPNTNTIFVIRYDYVLAENITIPDNCVLEFDGGSISAGSGANMDTIVFNNCDVEAPRGNTIFGETLNLKGLRYAHASWLGIVPGSVDSDSGSSKFIHFCSSPNCDGFELEFDKAYYRFFFHQVLLNKHMKLKGATNKSTEWLVSIDGECDYVIGVNRHCAISDLDIRLKGRDNQTGVDFFRVSNEWSDDEDAADSMKVNYDYYFDNIWLKGVWESDDDYTSSMNGIAIRVRDKQPGSSTLNKVLYLSDPQHCDNIMIEMVRAGIVFEVVSETVDVAWANGLYFNNIFVTGYIGYESNVNPESSSGFNMFSGFLYQGRSNTHGIYGILNGDAFVDFIAWDTYHYGCARGSLSLANSRFSDSGYNPLTNLKNGFLPYENAYPSVNSVSYKVNTLRFTPTAAKPAEGTVLHKLDYSENYQRSWKTRNDQNQKVEEYLDSTRYSKSVNIANLISEKKFNGDEVSTIYQAGTQATRITDWKSVPTGYGIYQDNAFITAYKEYGFKLFINRLNSGSFKIGDVLSFTYTFGLAQGVEDSMANKLLYINNIFCTAGEVNVSSITKNSTNIVLTGQVRIKHGGSLANDGIGIEYKILEPSNSFADETQTLWANKKYTESLTTQLLYHTIGTTSERPTSGLYVGMQYFDTSSGIEKPIWYNGTTWVDSTGTPV